MPKTHKKQKREEKKNAAEENNASATDFRLDANFAINFPICVC